MKDEVEVVGQAGEHLVVVDRRLDQADAIVGGDVLALGREQVVDHEDVAHVVREQRAHEIRADEAGAADDQDPRAGERPVAHCEGTFRCVKVCSMPYSR